MPDTYTDTFRLRTRERQGFQQPLFSLTEYSNYGIRIMEGWKGRWRDERGETQIWTEKEIVKKNKRN